MSEINWNELKDKAHSNAVKHGFWEGRPSDKHFLCLVISELMEAVNAHRRNKFARVPANRKETIFDDRTFHHENKYFRENFEEYVKDTVEDELADAAIRLLDIAGAVSYTHLDVYKRQSWNIKLKARMLKYPVNKRIILVSKLLSKL